MHSKKINYLHHLFLSKLIIFVILLCVVIITAQRNAKANTTPCVPVGHWKTPEDGSKVSEPQLLNDLNKRPVVMLGETHTNAEHHRWQLYVLSALYGKNQNMVIGFEAFPRTLQPILDRWTRGELSKDEFIKLTRWNEIWAYDPDLYMPLFHFARMHRIPMLALNVERSLIQKISQLWMGIYSCGSTPGNFNPETSFQRLHPVPNKYFCYAQQHPHKGR